MSARTTSGLATIRAILKFPLIRIPLLGGILFVSMGISNGFMASNEGSLPTALSLVLLVVALALTMYWAFVRFIEDRPVSELSLSGMGGEFGVGLLLGFGLFTACILILFLLGYYRIEGPELMTGGKFGVEASILAFLLCTATGIVLLKLAARRGRFLRPAWTRGDWTA